MPTDSTKAPRKTQPKKTATPAVEAGPLPDTLERADLHAVPNPDPEPVDDVDVPDGAVKVPFGDGHVYVKDQDDWPTSANEALMDRRFNLWASKALAREVDVVVWLAADPTARQVNEFFGHWNTARGVSVDDPKVTRRAMLSLAQ